MHEGTGPFIPGMSVGDPEGSIAQALDAGVRTRPALRLIRTQVTPRATARAAVIRLDVERALRQRLQGSLLGLGLACAIGISAGLFWCAALALLAVKARGALGDVGAFLLVAAVQIAAISGLVTWVRRLPHVRMREGTHR